MEGRRVTNTELIQALRRMKVETGSLVCLGCGHERNCSTHGCAILREAADQLETLSETARRRSGRWEEHDGKTWCSECGRSNKAYKPPFCPHCGAKMDLEGSDG